MERRQRRAARSGLGVMGVEVARREGRLSGCLVVDGVGPLVSAVLGVVGV